MILSKIVPSGVSRVVAVVCNLAAYHTSVDYGPCMSDDDFECKYKTMLKDYQVIGKGTKEERVLLAEGRYRSAYSEWSHLNNLKEDVVKTGGRVNIFTN